MGFVCLPWGIRSRQLFGFVGRLVYLMKHRILAILLVVFVACAKPGPGEPPFNLERLAPLIAELQIAEGITNEVPVVVRDSMRQVYYDAVLHEFSTNRTEFDSLLWLVRQEPAWVDSLYTKVGDILSKRQAERE